MGWGGWINWSERICLLSLRGINLLSRLLFLIDCCQSEDWRRSFPSFHHLEAFLSDGRRQRCCCWCCCCCHRIGSAKKYFFCFKIDSIRPSPSSEELVAAWPDWTIFNYFLGDFETLWRVFLGKSSPNLSKILGNFWNGTTFCLFVYCDLTARGIFLLKLSGHTELLTTIRLVSIDTYGLLNFSCTR